MKTLPPQELQYGDYKRLIATVDALLWDLIYKPVVDLVRPTMPKPVRADLAPRDMRSATPDELRNAADAEGQAALRKALQDGVVQMVRVPKEGRVLFYVAQKDRRISDGLRSFGARLDKTTDAWSCPLEDVPAWVRIEADNYGRLAREAHDRVKQLLDDLEGRIDSAVREANLAAGADHAITEVARGWKESAKELQVSWNLSDEGKRVLAGEMEKSAKIPIKGWAKEAVARLRDQVDVNAAQGFRATGLAEKIRNEYAVSKGRAELIARQEISNFMANFRMARAKDAGIHRYQWYAVLDARTRPDHKKLHGRVFYYDKPPIVDEASGRRGNPGQDFRCRCVDRPVLA